MAREKINDERKIRWVIEPVRDVAYVEHDSLPA